MGYNSLNRTVNHKFTQMEINRWINWKFENETFAYIQRLFLQNTYQWTREKRKSGTAWQPVPITVNIISHGTNWHWWPPDGLPWEHTLTSMICMPETWDLNLIIKTHQTHPNGRMFYKIINLLCTDVSRLWKSREDWETGPDWRKLKRPATKCPTWFWGVFL